MCKIFKCWLVILINFSSIFEDRIYLAVNLSIIWIDNMFVIRSPYLKMHNSTCKRQRNMVVWYSCHSKVQPSCPVFKFGRQIIIFSYFKSLVNCFVVFWLKHWKDLEITWVHKKLCSHIFIVMVTIPNSQINPHRKEIHGMSGITLNWGVILENR